MRPTGILLFCQDIQGMTAFYRDVLGVPPIPVQPFSPRKSFLFGEEGVCTLAPHSGTKPNGGRAKLTFQVEDLLETMGRLTAARVKLGACDLPLA